MVVKIEKKIAVFSPPPIFQEKYSGTKARREKRRVLEKPSDPPASAGSGAFFIEGYCGRCSQYDCNKAAQPSSRLSSLVPEHTYGCCPHTAILKFLKLRRWSFRGLNKFEFALGAIHTLSV
jgi:hypothetical protein